MLSDSSSDPSRQATYPEYQSSIMDWKGDTDGLISPSLTSRPRKHARLSRRYVTALACDTLLGFKIVRSPSRKLRLILLFLNFTAFSVAFIIIYSALQALLYPSYASPPAHYAQLETAALSSPRPGKGNWNGEKIFIASNIINAEFISGHWGQSLQQLIHYIGPDNVFVSIYENDSGPETVSALKAFAANLTCEHSIVHGDTISLNNFPSVVVPESGVTRVKRLTYLEEVRNRLLWPLEDPKNHPKSTANFTSTRFDKIFFINDVYFDPMDALKLIFATNYDTTQQKTDYRAACAIDFNTAVQHYDVFVVRDSQGYRTGLPAYPYFATSGSAESRKAVVAESDAVPVKSCWGGMVAFQADEFLRSEALESKNQPISLSPAHKTEGPLRFRHESETFWEAAECCLLHADLADRAGSAEPKIFMNPYVRTSYTAKAWYRRKFAQRYEKFFSLPQYLLSVIFYPAYNARRAAQAGVPIWQTEWRFEDDSLNGEKMRDFSTVYPQNRLKGAWRPIHKSPLPGGFCGERNLFTMKPDLKKSNTGESGKNWVKNAIPK